MSGVEWYVTLEGVEQGPLSPAKVKELVQAGMIGPMTPIRRGGMERAVAAAQVKGLLPPEMVARSGVGGPASVSERQPTTAARRRSATGTGELTDSGAQRVRGSVPSTRRLAVGTPEPDSSPVERSGPGRVPASTDPHDLDGPEDELAAGVEARASFGQRAAARLIDNVAMAVIALVFVVGGIALGASIPAGTLAEIDMARMGMTTPDGEGMPPYREWEVLRHQPLPEKPAAVIKGDEEEEEAFLARKAAYAEAYNDAVFQAQLYRWREDQYQIDLQRMNAATTQGAVISVLGIGFGLLLIFLYMPLTETIFAASPGKRLLGLAVADEDLRPVGIGKALLRQIGRLIPFGWLAALRANRLALHDQISASQVVPGDQVRAGRKTKRARKPRGGTARHGRRRR